MTSSYHKDFAIFYELISSHRNFTADISDFVQVFNLNQKSILDFGCGTGKHLSIIRGQKAINPSFLLGYEPSPFFRIDKQSLYLNSCNCDFTHSLDEIKNTFDFIVSWGEPLNFVAPPALKPTIKRLLDLTAPNGKWLFELWNPDVAIRQVYEPRNRIYQLDADPSSFGLDDLSTSILRTCSVEMRAISDSRLLKGTLEYDYKLYSLPSNNFITSTSHTIYLYDLLEVSSLLPSGSKFSYGLRPNHLTSSKASSVNSSTVFMLVEFPC